MPKLKAAASINEQGQDVYTMWRVHSEVGHPGFGSEAEARAFADDPAHGAFRIDEEVTTIIWEKPR